MENDLLWEQIRFTDVSCIQKKRSPIFMFPPPNNTCQHYGCLSTNISCHFFFQKMLKLIDGQSKFVAWYLFSNMQKNVQPTAIWFCACGCQMFTRFAFLKRLLYIFPSALSIFFCTQRWTRQAAYDPHFWNLSMLESDFFPDIFVKDPKKRDCRCHCHSNALNLTSFHIPMWPDIYTDVSPIPKLCSL